MNDMAIKMFQLLASSMPEEEFEARLKQAGIEEKHIKTLKNMAGYENKPVKEEKK